MCELYDHKKFVFLISKILCILKISKRFFWTLKSNAWIFSLKVNDSKNCDLQIFLNVCMYVRTYCWFMTISWLPFLEKLPSKLWDILMKVDTHQKIYINGLFTALHGFFVIKWNLKEKILTIKYCVLELKLRWSNGSVSR